MRGNGFISISILEVRAESVHNFGAKTTKLMLIGHGLCIRGYRSGNWFPVNRTSFGKTVKKTVKKNVGTGMANGSALGPVNLCNRCNRFVSVL